MADAGSSKKVTVPGLVEVAATQVSPPPAWALLQRRLMALMEESVRPMVDKYAEKGGAFYFADDVDDLYERVYNWACSTPWARTGRCSTWRSSSGMPPPVFSPTTSSAGCTPASAPRSTTSTTTRVLPARTSGTTRARATWLSTTSAWPIPPFRRTCAVPGGSRRCSSTRIPRRPTTIRSTGSSAAPCRPASAPCATPVPAMRSCGFMGEYRASGSHTATTAFGPPCTRWSKTWSRTGSKTPNAGTRS